MRKIFYPFFIFSLFTHTVLFGQTTDSTIAYVANWQKGDSKKYLVTKKKIEYRNGKLHKDETTTYIAKFEIKDVKKKAYDIEYQYENQLFSNAPQMDVETKAVTAKHNLQKIKYSTDEMGAFKGIQNWKEVSDLTKDIFNQIIKATPADKKENLKKALEPLVQAYSSKEGIEKLVLPELIYFHSPYGGLFNVHDTLTYEELLPNLMGGAPLKANGTIYYTFNAATKTNTMVNELVLDEKDALRASQEVITKSSANISYKSEAEKSQKIAEIQKQFAAMKMDIKDYTTYTYDEQSSWPLAISYKRKIIVNTGHANDNGERIQELIIEPMN